MVTEGKGVEPPACGAGLSGRVRPASHPNMPSKANVPRTCLECGSVFFTRQVYIDRGQSRYCSRSCSSKQLTHLLYGATGSENPAWKGGITKIDGYVYVLLPNHHRALRSGYVKRANLVLETKLGRELLDNEIAHHVNENKEDDSPGNLEPMDEDLHRKLHNDFRKKPKPPHQPEHPNNKRYSWPDDRYLVELCEKMSLRKVAAVIGCSHKAVDRRVKAIRERLRTKIKQCP